MSIIKIKDDVALAKENKAGECCLSVYVARKHGDYAGILYCYLLRKYREFQHFGDVLNKRASVKWIPGLTYQEIFSDLPVFADLKAVKRAADILEKAKLILREATGKFLESDHVTNRKRDLSTWWYVHDMEKLSSSAIFSEAKAFQVTEAQMRGIPQALILAQFREQADSAFDDQGKIYKRLSAIDLEKALPMDERTARRHLKALIRDGIIVPHPVKAKLYRLA